MTDDVPESWDEVIHGKDEREDGELFAGAYDWYREYYSGLPDSQVRQFQKEFQEAVDRGYDEVPNYTGSGWYRDSTPSRMARIKALLKIVTDILEGRKGEMT